ncbi:MAG: prepilin peptidase [Chloroflexota bacterium]
MMYFIYFIIFILGASIGSFLNVVIDRLPRGQSITNPPSHCPECNRKLRAWDMVPVLSYVWFRGHCRYCGAYIPVRTLLIEVLTGVLVLALFLYHGGGTYWGITAFYTFLLLAVAVIDLEHGIIPNKITYPALPVCLGLSAIYLPLQDHVWLGAVGLPHLAAVISALAGGGLGFFLFSVIALVSPGGMGWGDVKLVAVMGFMTGFPLILVALGISIILGGLSAAGMLILRRKGRKEAIPFGPFLCLGTFATLLWGGSILNWYIGLF